MASLQLQKLNHNAKKVSSYFITKNNVTTTTEDISIVFPSRYLKRKLAFIDTDIRVLGIFAIIDKKNNYGVSLAPIFLHLTPSLIRDIKVDDALVEYKALDFPKGSTVIPYTNSIVRDNFVYELFDEFINKAHVPFFLTYDDTAKLFAESKEYTGKGFGSKLIGFEFMTSVIARDAKDKTKFLRHCVNKNNVAYVSISDMIYSYNNTGAKLFGNYLAEGINSAIVDSETRSSKTTEILRR